MMSKGKTVTTILQPIEKEEIQAWLTSLLIPVHQSFKVVGSLRRKSSVQVQ